MSSLQFHLDSGSQADKTQFWKAIEDELKPLEPSALANVWVSHMQRFEAKGKRAVVIIDGLDRINYGGFEKVVQVIGSIL